jgi:hypothetical protein
MTKVYLRQSSKLGFCPASARGQTPSQPTKCSTQNPTQPATQKRLTQINTHTQTTISRSQSNITPPPPHPRVLSTCTSYVWLAECELLQEGLSYFQSLRRHDTTSLHSQQIQAHCQPPPASKQQSTSAGPDAGLCIVPRWHGATSIECN